MEMPADIHAREQEVENGNIDIPEKVVNELLKKVKKRRKLVRSYIYFTWFCIFFLAYLGNLYIKTVTPKLDC